MSNILNSEDFGLKIYNRFPPKYREDDVGQRYSLRRYLQALSDGGFKYSIDEINGISHLIDPNKVDAKVLPILFKQYGLELFNGIPEEYLRYLLPRLGEAWHKKGSLSVVEFITSSLSGVRTETNVVYDDKGNPIVDVHFEMDYSLGDYFPDSDQFKKLLVNFLPFNSDVNFIYMYTFIDHINLKGEDEDLLNVRDISQESSRFSLRRNFEATENESIFGSSILGKYILGVPPIHYTDECEVDEHIADIIRYVFKEPMRFRISDTPITRITSPILLPDEATLEPRDYYSLNNVSLTNIERAEFSLWKPLEKPLQSSVFGSGVFGRSILNVSKDPVDTFRDTVSERVFDSGKLSNPIDTLINKGYNTLNNNFFTNAVYSYDKVTIGDTTEVVF